MKSKIEIRHEAAYQIETYLTGEAQLSETSDEMDVINKVFDCIRSSQAFECISNF